MEISEYAFHSNRFIEEALRDKLPLKDAHAYLAYPEHRWVFHKIDLYQRQGIPACPHGVLPHLAGVDEPLFSKPSTNMLGLSTGTEKFLEYPENYYLPGYMWMPYLEGEHISIDVFVKNGEVCEVFDLVVPSKIDRNGSFMLWSKSEPLEEQIEITKQFISKHLRGWSGITNVEMIGNTILEIPLRSGTQFVDFYFDRWAAAAEKLTGVQFAERSRPNQNISYVVRSPLDSKTARTPFSVSDRQIHELQMIEKELAVNIYLPWQNNRPMQAVNHDGYSVRLAFINAADESAALRAWEAVQEVVFGPAKDIQLP